MVDRQVLERLGWSKELIDAAAEATQLSATAYVTDPGFDVIAYESEPSGSNTLDVGDAPAIASSSLPPPVATKRYK